MPLVSRRGALQAVPAVLVGLSGCTALGSDEETLSTTVPSVWGTRLYDSKPGFLSDNGTLVLGSGNFGPDDVVAAGLDAETGEQRWTLAGTEGATGSPVTGDGSVGYAVSTSGAVRALNPDSGGVTWRTDLDLAGDVSFSAAPLAPRRVGNALAIPVSPSDDDADHRVVGLDPEDGSRRWTYPLAAPLGGAPDAADGRLVLPRTDGVLEAIDAGGNRVWRTETPAHLGPVTAADGRAYVGGVAERLAAFDLDSGVRRWDLETENAVFTRPRVVDGTVYVGATDQYLYAADAATGERQWRAGTPVGVTGGPVVVGDAVVTRCGAPGFLRYRKERVAAQPVVVSVHDATDGERRSEYVYDEDDAEGRPPAWVDAAGGSVYVGNGRSVVKLDGGALDA